MVPTQSLSTRRLDSPGGAPLAMFHFKGGAATCSRIASPLPATDFSMEILDAISVVRGLANRVLREDQPDWIWSWYRLGLPRRARLRRVVSGLVALRKAIKDSTPDKAEGSAVQLERAGLLTFLDCFRIFKLLVIPAGVGVWASSRRWRSRIEQRWERNLSPLSTGMGY